MPKTRASDSALLAEGKSPASSTLVLRATTGARLRGPQLEFNRLTRRIATLQNRIVKERERLEELLRRFLVTVGPIEAELAPRQLVLAKAVSEAHARWRLKGSDIEEVRHLILELVGDVLAVEGPLPEAVALRREWSRGPRPSGDRAKNAAIKRKLREEFRAEFGFEAELLDDGDDSIEGFERFRERMGEEIRRADEDATRRRAQARLNKRDLRKRKRLADQETVRLRSVRAIYIALAKLLHPDATAQADERARRENDMKRAAEAYRQQDLVTLLELEQRWGARDGHGIDRLGDDALEVYIATLRQRVKALDRELALQIYDRRFSQILPVAELSNRRAASAIEERAEMRREDRRRVEKLIGDLAGCKGKRELTRLVAQYHEYDERRLELEIERAFAEDD